MAGAAAGRRSTQTHLQLRIHKLTRVRGLHSKEGEVQRRGRGGPGRGRGAVTAGLLSQGVCAWNGPIRARRRAQRADGGPRTTADAASRAARL